MKTLLSTLAAVVVTAAASSAFAAGETRTKANADECPQSVCVANGLRQGHANAEAWCKANRKTKLTGPTCQYR
jgi:hypothetical protein